jgi:iron complex transport system substrate-binding protein
MKYWIGIMLLLFISSCKKNNPQIKSREGKEIMHYASGLSIKEFEFFTLVKVHNPWPNSSQEFQYVLSDDPSRIPDSLQHLQFIKTPIQQIVVTSTTHIPPLELLGLEDKLIGFPNTSYISSQKTRALVDAGRIREVGTNQSLNTEVLLDIGPEVIVGFGVEGQNASYDLLIKNGIPVIYNGDWTEENALGRAEWIKLFGVLFGKSLQAHEQFSTIEKSFFEAERLLASVNAQPTVMSGAIYQDQWFAPQGNSWAAQFITLAKGNYIWKDTKGLGSLSFSFETVLEQAQNTEIWIGPGQFTSYNQMLKANPNYQYFKAFQNKNIYSFSAKKGATGGVIYYEEAFSKPDLILKDLIKILHPQLLPTYKLYFFEALNE